MKLKIQLISFFFLTFLFGFLFTKSTFATNYTLSGSVKNNVGDAIGSATVHVYNANTTTDVVPPVVTDTNTGNYSVPSVPQGSYDVQVIPPSGSNFSSAIALSQNISADTVLNFILTSASNVSLSGHIYGPLGNALPNQFVYLENPSTGSTLAQTTTNASGSYSLTASPGTYRLYISSPNTLNADSLNVPKTYFLQVSNYSLAQSTVLDITVPAKQVSVHVQNTSEQAVGNVQLTTTNPFTSNLSIGGNITNATGQSSYGVGNVQVATTATDSSGNATLWLLPTVTNQNFTITATPPNGSNYPVTSVSNISITADTQETITLPTPVSLSGHIYGPLGNALPNQFVFLENSSTGAQVAFGTTDASGFYSVNAIPGSYTLLIQSPNTLNADSLNVPKTYLLQVSNYSLTQSTNLDVTLPAKQVSVHIQDATGNPVASVQLTTTSTNSFVNTNLSIGGSITNAAGSSSYGVGSVRIPTTATDSSGNATLWLFPTSSGVTYTIKATPPSGSNYSIITTPDVSITGDTQETITLPTPVTLSGHIYGPLGNALTNQFVYLQDLSTGAQVAFGTTDASGFYSLNVIPGSYTLEIQSPNTLNANALNAPKAYYLIAHYSITQSTVLDVTVPAKQVSIHVQDASGNPVSNVQLTTTPASTDINNNLSIGGLTNVRGGSWYGVGNVQVATTATDLSGNATLWLLPTGSNSTYTITATPPSGSIYSIFTLNNISVISDQTDIVSLQYNHPGPATTLDLAIQNQDSTYSDPTTVTLSATAASGYTVANTYYTIDGGAQQTYTAPFTVTGNGSHTITYWSVDNSSVQETHSSKTFTILTTYTLSGTVYNDANQNGFQDINETGVSGATVSLNTGQSTTTDSNGNYSFTGLVAETYTETLTVPDSDIATTQNPATISLSNNTTQNFGIAPSGPTLVTAINAGGDTEGNYLADTDYTGGNSFNSSATVDTSGVDNPAPEAVYQTVRYGNTFGYTIPGLTPGGTYTVRLHFNELYWGTALGGNSGGEGSRVFNVAINGIQVLSNFDIYATAGGSNKAITEQFPVTPDSNGNVTINFTSVTDNAMVNGVDIYSGTLPSPTPTPTPTPATSAIINAGGSTVGSFVADNSYSGGTTYSSSASVDTSNVTSPAPEALYQTVRYGNTFAYNIKNLVPNHNFLVRLHFNELYWTSAGKRVFNVAINGNQVLHNFDVFQEAGGANKALVEDFILPSDSNGKINITFTSVTDNAMVSGIEIVEPSIPQRTYYTANDGTDFTRATSSFVSGVATQTVNSDGSITESVNNAPEYADSGFVLYEGTLGNLPNFTTIGSGDQYGLNLWLDTNNDNEYFAWDSNNILSGLSGDTYALSNGSQNGQLNVNGLTSFFLMSNGQSYSLSDLKAGLAPGINGNTKVAVWVGVNTNSGSTSSTIQSVNGL